MAYRYPIKRTDTQAIQTPNGHLDASPYRYDEGSTGTLQRAHLSIDTRFWVSIPLVNYNSEYRYPSSSIDTLSCRSAFIAGRKLPNGSIDDLTYQNGWKSVR
ncbi:hypothetical protein GQ457_14G020670 [Hibiscus cannabinus]